MTLSSQSAIVQVRLRSFGSSLQSISPNPLQSQEFALGKGEVGVLLLVLLAVFLYAMLSMVLQSSITAVSRQGSERGRRLNREGLRIGSLLKFLPPRVLRSDGLDSLRLELRIGVRAPKLALLATLQPSSLIMMRRR